MTPSLRRSPLPWLGALALIYLAVPLAGLAVHVASSPERGFGTPGLYRALLTSILTATISTALIATFGVPLAYVLNRSTGRFAQVCGVVVLLPLALPPLMGGILLISVVGPYSSLGQFAGGRLTDSLAGVVIAQTFVAAPFAVVAARSAFSAVDPAFTEVAATQGMTEWTRFLRVSLPIAMPGVAAGLLLSWMRAFGEFGATVIVAYHPTTLPVFTYVQFSATGLSNTLAPATLAVLAAAAVVVATRAALASRPRRPVALPAPGLPAPATGGDFSFTVEHRLGDFELSVNTQVNGRHLAVIGPSGAGKSTLLRCLAGLTRADHDEVHVGPRSLGQLPPERRGVGYVPQGQSLLPGRPTTEQVLFGPRAQPALGAYWIEELGLGPLLDRRPHELSGGQQQRVSLARALASAPVLLLLDEPLSALDTPVRREVRQALRQVLERSGLASVLVTHDPEEAASLADDILVLVEGRVLQSGPVDHVFSRPVSSDVARLLGLRNVGRGRLDQQSLDIGGATLATTTHGGPDGAVLWSVPPESVSLVGSSGLPGVIIDVDDLGTAVECAVELAPGVVLVARRSRDLPTPDRGDRCGVLVPREAVRVWVPGEVSIS